MRKEKLLMNDDDDEDDNGMLLFLDLLVAYDVCVFCVFLREEIIVTPIESFLCSMFLLYFVGPYIITCIEELALLVTLHQPVLECLKNA